MIPLIHFKESEFIMGGEYVGNKMNQGFLLELDTLRSTVDMPFQITSSFRSFEYNKSVGGSKGSFHLQGRAVDISCLDGVKRARITKAALNQGLSVGVAKTFVHIDNRSNQIIYSY